MKGIVTFLFLFLASLSFGQKVRYVYSSTTAAAIDELNLLVGDYEKRKAVLLNIKAHEAKGKVVLSTKEFEPIQERVDSLLPDLSDETRLEELAYIKKVEERYVLITDLIYKK